MSEIDFGLFYRQHHRMEDLSALSYDTFVTAYNRSERVLEVAKRVVAARRILITHAEYDIPPAETSALGYVEVPLSSGDEAEDLAEVLDRLKSPLDSGRLAIDCTGMMRAHLALLIPLLFSQGYRQFDLLYAEPKQYRRKESTAFALGEITEVRPVRGCEGTHSVNTSEDLLIVGSGYDSQLISHVAEAKKAARKIQLLGLPSLRADMYQENVIRAHEAVESLGQSRLPRQDYFAPANDPFAVADELRRIYKIESSRRRVTNLYLCPLATKPQVIGFALYHFLFWQNREASILFPFASKYEPETSKGWSRVWQYTIEAP